MTYFSIIIPTSGRRSSLRSLLLKLFAQKFDGRIEVIVVNNAHIETKLFKKIKKDFARKVRFFNELRLGPSYARNTGFLKARYKHVIFLDDDVLLSKTFLKNSAQAWKEHPEAGIICGIIKFEKPELLRVPHHLLIDCPWLFVSLNFGEKARPLFLMENVYSAHMQYRANSKSNTQFGPFSLTLGNYMNGRIIGGEDYELTQRVIMSGEEVWYCPTIFLTHLHNRNFSYSYLLQRQWQGGYEIALAESLLLKKYPEFHHHTFLAVLKRDLWFFLRELFKLKIGYFPIPNILVFVFYFRYLLYRKSF
jgi:glycosyltransferase involved in cell wall biosynthesis